MSLFQRYFAILIYLLAQFCQYIACDIYQDANIPLIFLRSPFEGSLTRGKVAPLTGSPTSATSTNSINNILTRTSTTTTKASDQTIMKMKSVGPRVTIARIVTNADRTQSGPARWTGAMINVYAVADGMRLVFSHHFRDHESVSMKTLEDYYMIEPMSYVNEPMVSCWTANLDDVAEDAPSRDHTIVGYTFTFEWLLPSIASWEALNNRISISSSDLLMKKQQTFVIEFVPMINDQPIKQFTVSSQPIIFYKDHLRRNKLTQQVHGVFKRMYLANGGYLLTPSIPNLMMRKAYLTHDIILDMSENRAKTPFKVGVWDRDHSKYMKISFFQFRPAGKSIFGPWNSVQVYLVDCLTGEEISLDSVRDYEAKMVKLDGGEDTTTPSSDDKDYDSQKSKFMDRAFANQLDNPNPPKWAKSHTTNGMEVRSAAFKLPNNRHGGILKYRFEQQSGRLYYYTFWIDFRGSRKSGRYQFKFTSMTGSRNKESYSEDFWIDDSTGFVKRVKKSAHQSQQNSINPGLGDKGARSLMDGTGSSGFRGTTSRKYATFSYSRRVPTSIQRSMQSSTARMDTIIEDGYSGPGVVSKPYSAPSIFLDKSHRVKKDGGGGGEDSEESMLGWRDDGQRRSRKGGKANGSSSSSTGGGGGGTSRQYSWTRGAYTTTRTSRSSSTDGGQLVPERDDAVFDAPRDEVALLQSSNWYFRPTLSFLPSNALGLSNASERVRVVSFPSSLSATEDSTESSKFLLYTDLTWKPLHD